MNRKFFQDGGRRSYRIRTAEKLQASLLCRCDEAPCHCLVAIDVAVDALGQVGGSHGICIGNRLDVGGIVEAVGEHLLVGLHQLGFLLAELLLEICVSIVERTVEHIEAHSQGEHVLGAENRLGVEAAVGQALLGQTGDRGPDDVAVLYVELGRRVFGGKTGLLETRLVECIYIHDDGCGALGPLGIGLEGGGVHGHQHVTIVARGVDPFCSEVNLESRYAGDCALRGADFCRIVGECGNFVAIECRRVGKQGSGELHPVAAIARKPYDNILCVNNFVIHRIVWYL